MKKELLPTHVPFSADSAKCCTGFYLKFADFKQYIVNNPDLYKKSRMIAIDFGRKKIGIACSDLCWIISSPFRSYRRQNTTADLKNIADIIIDNEVRIVLFGLPYLTDDLNNTHFSGGCHSVNNSWIDQIKSFAKALYLSFSSHDRKIVVGFYNESLSTFDAHRMMHAHNVDLKDDDIMASFLIMNAALRELSDI